MSARIDRWTALLCLCLAGVLSRPVGLPARPAQTPTPSATQPAESISDAEIEQFLRQAKVVTTRGAGKGVTNSLRATLSDGTRKHDAQIQTVDERKTTGPSSQGTELNFRDSWMFNVAGYRLDRLIGLNLVPVSVERDWNGKAGAFTWWVDDVLMDEKGRLEKKLQPPDPMKWNEQMQLVRIFDQLIYNMDRNMGNLLIGKDWRVWAIDHTRAFRLHKTLKTPGNITRCDKQLLDGLKRLDRPTLDKEVGKYLTGWERDAMLTRRDLIVALIEKAGPSALFERRH